MATQFDKFIATMKTVLMLDQADLDFGIYRIMNQKRDQIESYLNNDLRWQVTEAIRENASNDAEAVKKELTQLVATLTAAGMNPDDAPKVKELKERIARCGNSEELENEVYSHLTIFFGRYYDGGDFISQRRYKKDVYAIPYEGEEVKLYWANADQYYIKTAEYFRNYRFAVNGDKFCEFTLREATTEQNNNVAQNNMERRFALCEETPVEVIGNTLHIYFTYELYPKATKQKGLIEAAYETIKDAIPAEFAAVLALRPTESDRTRTLLQKHLNTYVARNTFDYFIHKDLGGFLSRELDFYIKNEILVIDDIDARTPDEFLKHLTVIKAIKRVGMKLITFLASLENYQKRLWLKKKFVVESNYCITLDRVPEKFYAEIAANDAQREEWMRLFAIDEITSQNTDGSFVAGKSRYSVPLTVEFLKENPFLVLDTKFFPAEFKNALLASIDHIDEQCDGLLINSENFQALGLLQEKYKEQVKCVYIDPPYNTGDDGFTYKDGYSDSCWLSMINDRLMYSDNLMNQSASTMISIGDEEQEYLSSLIRQKVGKQSFVATLIWEKKKKGSFLSGNIAKMKDYVLCYVKNINEFGGYIGEINAEIETYPCVNPDNPRSVRLFRAGIKSKYRNPSVFKPAGSVISAGNMTLTLLHDLIIEDNILKQDVAIEANWRYSQDSLNEFMNSGSLYITQDLYIRRIVVEARNKRLKDLLLRTGEISNEDFRKYDVKNVNKYGWETNEDANDELLQLFGEQYIVSYPKPSKLITLLLASNRKDNNLILDYFAGSGTTGHSVINLNREDGGKRKYILCEMGEYFNTVTKPRIQKVIYSKDWDGGKPESREGSSHCFKYMRLEQYEDTLNNLTIESVNISKDNADFYDGYVLGYMLDIETRDSLFNMKWFRNPWNMKLRITRQNETREEKIDVIETFNYLIGLNVTSILYPKKGICTVDGVTRSGERTLVIWRDCDTVDNDALNDSFRRMSYSTRDTEFDRIYVNGDNNLENLRTDGEQWKVVLTEQEFAKRMFEDC